jgi:hypothetical protein
MDPDAQETTEPVVAGTVVVTGVVTLTPVQAPLLHVCPLPQVCPQVPQLLVSAWVFRQVPLQEVCPDAQVIPGAGVPVVRDVDGIAIIPAVQTPLLQYWEALQVLPHRPQLLESTKVFRQAPPQVVWPSAQAPPGTAADGPGVAVAGVSVIRGCAELLPPDREVHPPARSRQRIRHRKINGVTDGERCMKGKMM